MAAGQSGVQVALLFQESEKLLGGEVGPGGRAAVAITVGLHGGFLAGHREAVVVDVCLQLFQLTAMLQGSPTGGELLDAMEGVVDQLTG